MVDSNAFTMRPASLCFAHDMALIHATAGQAAWDERSLQRVLAEPISLAFAAVIGGEVIGSIFGRAVAGEAEILGFAVSIPWRCRGVGRRLAEAFLSGARTRGVNTVFLEVAQSNAAALALYGRLGFVSTGRRAGYYSENGSLVDAALMSRGLGDAANSHMRSESRLPTSSGAPKCSK